MAEGVTPSLLKYPLARSLQQLASTSHPAGRNPLSILISIMNLFSFLPHMYGKMGLSTFVKEKHGSNDGRGQSISTMRDEREGE